MLDNNGGRCIKLINKLPRCFGVKDIEVAHFFAIQLQSRIPPTSEARQSVSCPYLMWIFSVSQNFISFSDNCEYRRKRGINTALNVAAHPSRHCSVIRTRNAKCFCSQLSSSNNVKIIVPNQVKDSVVVADIDNDADMGMIFSGCPNHGWSTNINQLNTWVGRERIQVHHYQ